MPRGNPARKITFRLQPELIARIDAIAAVLEAHRPQALEYAVELAEHATEQRRRQKKPRKPT